MKRSGTRVALVVAGLAAAMLSVLAVGVVFVLAARAVVLRDQAQAAGPPYQHPGPGAADFDRLMADYVACLGKGGADAARLWDVPRLAREVDRAGVLTRSGYGPGHPDRLASLAGTVANTADRYARADPVDEYRIRSVRWLVPGREAVLDTRLICRRPGTDRCTPHRWWVVFDGGWRFYDHQEAGATRLSAVEEMDIDERSRGRPADEPARDAAQAAFDRALAVHRAGDLDHAERLLAEPVLDRIRASERPNRLRWQAQVAADRSKFPEAFAFLDRADRLDPDSAFGHRLRAQHHSEAGQYEQAVAAADRYFALMAPDRDLCLTRAHALFRLGRKAEAAAEYRRALDDDPDDPDALEMLADCLGAAGAAEVEARFRQSGRPAATLAALADSDRIDRATVAALVRVVREVAPADPEGLFQDARLKLAAGDVPAAVGLVRKAMAGGGEAGDGFLDRFAADAAARERAADVYRAFPDPDADRVFRLLAEAAEDEADLSEADDGTRFAALLDAHRARRPKDVWLAHFDGVLANAREQYARAEERFADAHARAPDDDARERVRWARVENLVDAGRAGEAYAKVGPARATFAQLATRLDRPGARLALAALVAAHEKADPADPELRFCRGSAAFRRGDYERAVGELRGYLAGEGRGHEWLGRDRLVRSLVRLGRVAEARAALPPREKGGFAYSVLPAVVAAASGDVAATERELDALAGGRGPGPAWFHADPDLSAALKTEPFRRLLDKYPPPAPKVP